MTHRKRPTPLVIVGALLVVALAATHALHLAGVADLSEVLPWLSPFPAEADSAPRVAPAPSPARPRQGVRVPAHDAGAGARAVTGPAGADAGAGLAGSDAGAALHADGGVARVIAVDGGAPAAATLDGGTHGKRAPRAVPDDPTMAYEVGKQLVKEKEWEDAVLYLEFARKSKPDSRALLTALANAYAGAGRAKDAAKIRDRFRKQDILARAYSYLSRNPQRALLEFREIQEKHKTWPEAYLGEAKAQKALGNEAGYKKAMEKYNALTH